MGAVNGPAPPPSAVRHLHSASWAPSSLPIRCSSLGLPRRPFLFLLRSPPPPRRRLGNNRVRCSAERHALFNRIAPVYDNLNDMLSLGQHRSWKRMCVSWSGAKRGNRVLDLCCGSGDLVFFLSQKVGTEGEVRFLYTVLIFFCSNHFFHSLSFGFDMMIHNFFFSKKRRTILTQKPITSYSLLIQAQNTVKVFITLHSMIKLSRAKISRRKLRRNQGGDSSSLFKTFTIHPASVSMSSLFTPSWIAAEISSLTAKNSFAQELPASRNLQPARRHLAALFLSTKPAPPIFEWASKAPSSYVLTNLQVYGLDFSREQLSVASRREDLYWKACYKNIEWIEGDALDLPFSDGYFDAITIGYGLRNLIDRQKAMREIFRVLKPGSKVSILDFNKSTSSLVNMLQEWIIDNVVVPTASEYGLSQEYKYLKTSIDEFLTGKELEKLAKEVGFSKAEHYEIGGGFMGNLVATR
ncbi:unnamed protein product [Musa acuminata var. zebrina]